MFLCSAQYFNHFAKNEKDGINGLDVFTIGIAPRGHFSHFSHFTQNEIGGTNGLDVGRVSAHHITYFSL